jgi:hypothetical protein
VEDGALKVRGAGAGAWTLEGGAERTGADGVNDGRGAGAGRDAGAGLKKGAGRDTGAGLEEGVG